MANLDNKMQDQQQYLISFFKYNDWANLKILDAIRLLQDKGEAIKLFSHFITAQDKWMNRITQKVADSTLTWFGKIFSIEEIEKQWRRSTDAWIQYIENLPVQEIDKDIEFTRPTDGQKMRVKLSDIALQLNYHSIHHRAQINTIIRQQGLTPPATDYILTVLKEI